MAKITLVTPSYNQASFLEETLRSVLSQRDQLHEYFVCDGASNDGSVEMIRKYADQGGIDYWHSQKDRGQSDAIDQGFKRASGDYLGWLNSDDVLLPGALALVNAAFDAHPEWDVLTGYHVQMDADSRITAMHRIPRDSPFNARWGVIHVAQQTCFFRKSLYDRVGGLDLSLHCVMDTELWIRMFEADARWGHIPRYLAGFRHHADAKGSSWLKEYAQERDVAAAKHPQYIRHPRRRIGLPLYRLSQITSGRYAMAKLDTRRNRGQKLTDVFGCWELPPA